MTKKNMLQEIGVFDITQDKEKQKKIDKFAMDTNSYTVVKRCYKMYTEKDIDRVYLVYFLTGIYCPEGFGKKD